MAKINRMTKKAVMEYVKGTKGLNVRFETTSEPVREPGVIGTAMTANGNYLVYCVNENGKLFHTSVHANRREANGQAYRRIVEYRRAHSYGVC